MSKILKIEAPGIFPTEGSLGYHAPERIDGFLKELLAESKGESLPDKKFLSAEFVVAVANRLTTDLNPAALGYSLRHGENRRILATLLLQHAAGVIDFGSRSGVDQLENLVRLENGHYPGPVDDRAKQVSWGALLEDIMFKLGLKYELNRDAMPSNPKDEDHRQQWLHPDKYETMSAISFYWNW